MAHAVLVQGPYMVRSALITPNNTLELTGDIDKPIESITIFAPSILSVSWNGQVLDVTKDGNTLTATLDGPPEFALPSLGPWKWHDSLPETQSNYSVSTNTWISASFIVSHYVEYPSLIVSHSCKHNQ